MTEQEQWYKDGSFWRNPPPQWEIENYGQALEGLERMPLECDLHEYKDDYNP